MCVFNAYISQLISHFYIVVLESRPNGGGFSFIWSHVIQRLFNN